MDTPIPKMMMIALLLMGAIILPCIALIIYVLLRLRSLACVTSEASQTLVSLKLGLVVLCSELEELERRCAASASRKVNAFITPQRCVEIVVPEDVTPGMVLLLDATVCELWDVQSTPSVGLISGTALLIGSEVVAPMPPADFRQLAQCFSHWKMAHEDVSPVNSDLGVATTSLAAAGA